MRSRKTCQWREFQYRLATSTTTQTTNTTTSRVIRPYPPGSDSPTPLGQQAVAHCPHCNGSRKEYKLAPPAKPSMIQFPNFIRYPSNASFRGASGCTVYRGRQG